MNFSEVYDMQPSFLNSKSEREEKERLMAQITEDEMIWIKSMYKQLEEIETQVEIPASEIVNNQPSWFDDEREKKAKLGNLEAWGCEEHVINDLFLDLKKCPPKETEVYRNAFTVMPMMPPMVVETAIAEENCFGNFSVLVEKEINYIEEIVSDQNIVIERKENVCWDFVVTCLGKSYKVRTDVQELLKDSTILKVTQGRGYLENGKEEKKVYKKYLNKLISSEVFPKEYWVNSTGWVKLGDGKFYYVTDQGIIGHPEIPVRANVSYKFLYDSSRVGTKEVFDEVVQMRNLCFRKPENSILLFHYMLTAVLTTLFQESGHGVNFIVALIGTTNSQKTSSAMIFSRMFDRTSVATPDIRFNSTEIAIAEKMETYGDAILLVDDFLPCQSKAAMREQMKKSELIIRSYGDRVPRKRSKVYAQANNVAEYSRVKGCCIMTGEVFDTNSESSATRVIQLNFERGDVDLNLLSFYQHNLLNVPTFLYDFISFIEGHIAEFKDVLKKEISMARNDVELKLNTSRLRDSVAIFSTEIHFFYLFAEKRGWLTKIEAENMKRFDMMKIIEVIQHNESIVSVKSPATIIFQSILNALEKGILQIVDVKTAKKIQCLDIIVEVENYLCMLPDSVWKYYALYCKEKGYDVMYANGRELAGPLKKESALLIREEQENSRATHKVSGIGNSKRYFYIKKDVFKSSCENFEKI